MDFTVDVINEIKLRSCPICGDVTSIFIKRHRDKFNAPTEYCIKCNDCGCNLGWTSDPYELRGMIDLWNNRSDEKIDTFIDSFRNFLQEYVQGQRTKNSID